MGNKKEETYSETRTLEQLLRDLRIEKNWNYEDVSNELNKLGISIDVLQIRKWEYGLEYPNLEIMYKLSELYFVPSETLILARDNSFSKDYNSIHARIIRWFCYITGFTFKIGYFFFYFILTIAIIGAFIFFLLKANSFYW